MSENTEQRLRDLETHLQEENDVLYDVVKIFRKLDHIAYEMGILEEDQSYAMRVSWWPMVSVLGTFSAGKSSFINYYLGRELQRTGNQAVDDKFTVISFTHDANISTLPGIALDSDPRFPFYQISRDIAEITTSDGHRVDAYLQLKTCNCDILRGKIIIDSPGFDADSQRTETLKITKHIIDLSDLVLVFFDARHPEPGAMRDTLQHLVTETINRPDSNKFMYILNQVDITAREDNLEEVVAAWQRSLASAGLTAGRFYRIYNPNAAVTIEDVTMRERLEAKNTIDMNEIRERMNQVGIERAYRIVGVLEYTAKEIEHRIVPQLQELIASWKRKVMIFDLVVYGLLAMIAFASVKNFGWTLKLPTEQYALWGSVGGAVFVILLIHYKIAQWIAKRMHSRLLQAEDTGGYNNEGLARAFRFNTGFWRTLFMPLISEPAGWSSYMRKRVRNVLSDLNQYIQLVNNRFTNPSGKNTDSNSDIPVG
jgi:GTPase Era involved in 16S rRNA processing